MIKEKRAKNQREVGISMVVYAVVGDHDENSTFDLQNC